MGWNYWKSPHIQNWEYVSEDKNLIAIVDRIDGQDY